MKLGVDNERGHVNDFKFAVTLRVCNLATDHILTTSSSESAQGLECDDNLCTLCHARSVRVQSQQVDMSRGDRVIASGNISSSMRDNYGELGVEEVSTGVHSF